MKKFFAIAALTLLASTTWADQNADGGEHEITHKHSQGSQMMDHTNCSHTHPMGSATDSSEILTPFDGE